MQEGGGSWKREADHPAAMLRSWVPKEGRLLGSNLLSILLCPLGLDGGGSKEDLWGVPGLQYQVWHEGWKRPVVLQEHLVGPWKASHGQRVTLQWAREVRNAMTMDGGVTPLLSVSGRT